MKNLNGLIQKSKEKKKAKESRQRLRIYFNFNYSKVYLQDFYIYHTELSSIIDNKTSLYIVMLHFGIISSQMHALVSTVSV